MTKLGIIGAMQVEVETLLGEMTNGEPSEKREATFMREPWRGCRWWWCSAA